MDTNVAAALQQINDGLQALTDAILAEAKRKPARKSKKEQAPEPAMPAETPELADQFLALATVDFMGAQAALKKHGATKFSQLDEKAQAAVVAELSQ
jgi:hypothetical protein